MVVLFACAWCVGVASWFFGIFEAIGILRFRDWVFRIGPVAKAHETRSECPIGLSAVSAAETEHAKYRVLEGHRCLFRRKFRLLEFRWNTPLEIKGVISWSNGTLTTMGRYPLGVTLFFAAWLAGWTVGGVMILIKGQLMGVLFIGLGWLFALGITAHSRSLELKRFSNYAGEVQAALGFEARGTQLKNNTLQIWKCAEPWEESNKKSHN